MTWFLTLLRSHFEIFEASLSYMNVQRREGGRATIRGYHMGLRLVLQSGNVKHGGAAYRRTTANSTTITFKAVVSPAAGTST